MPEQINVIKECIEVDEVKQALQANKKIQIIDVRSKEEYEQAHIPNALNISLQELKNNRVTQGNLTPTFSRNRA
ncbi:MAG: rhodanese-like domain-containing protein [Saprospiraceae bacterium]|nr:rhodanese-like domain-containing protein [Saprospiraceae bacterium]